MKAKELIEELQKLDPDTELFTRSCCYGFNPVGGITTGLDNTLLRSPIERVYID